MTTPQQPQPPYPGQPQDGYPPQGGAPYGQQPPPPGYPTPPPGGYGYPQQTPPPSPFAGGPQGGYPPPAPAPTRSSGKGKPIKIIVGLAVVAAIGIGVYITSKNDANHAKAGDCMHKTGGTATSPELETIDCGKADARYKVLKKINHGTETDCKTQAPSYRYVYTETQGGSSFALCLADNH
jgi:hypothetical protein